MLPGQLPQQRVHEVVALEPRPADFEPIVGYGVVPVGILPKDQPRNAAYVGQMEWAWSPMNNRLDAYYLHRGRAHWVLWTRYWDDNWGRWEWVAAAAVARRGVTERQAATHLLIDFWRAERAEGSLDHFHWINEGGLLSVEDLMAIGRVVWDD